MTLVSVTRGSGAREAFAAAWLACTLLTLAGCVPHARTPRGAAPEDLDTPLVDERFDGAPFDTGLLRARCFAGAPWGGRSWGIEGGTFSRPGVFSLAASRFSGNGRDAYLWGRDDTGEWGFVRYIQGSAWADTNCGPTPWRRFRPFDTWGRTLDLGIRVQREQTRLLHPERAWVLFALNVWLASPSVRAQGGSMWGRKPIVMDLAVHHETTSPTARLRQFEDQWAYHYQVEVGEAPVGTWQQFQIPLSQHVREAVRRFGLPPEVERTLQIAQLEFVIELHHSEGSARIDDFTLRRR